MEDVSAQDSPEVCPEEVEEGDEGEEAGKFLPQDHIHSIVCIHTALFSQRVSHQPPRTRCFILGAFLDSNIVCMCVCGEMTVILA